MTTHKQPGTIPVKMVRNGVEADDLIYVEGSVASLEELQALVDKCNPRSGNVVTWMGEFLPWDMKAYAAALAELN
jgi:hypothetical protein